MHNFVSFSLIKEHKKTLTNLIFLLIWQQWRERHLDFCSLRRYISFTAKWDLSQKANRHKGHKRQDVYNNKKICEEITLIVLISCLSKHIPNGFVVSVITFSPPPPTRHNVHLLNYGSVWRKIKVGMVYGGKLLRLADPTTWLVSLTQSCRASLVSQ